MSYIKIRGESYKVNKFTDVHLLPFAQSVLTLSQGKLFSFSDLANLVKLLIPDIPETLVAEDNVYLELEELRDLYTSLIKIWEASKHKEVDYPADDEDDDEYPIVKTRRHR